MNHRRSILFLVSSMQAGGAERVASLLSNYWADNGHEVTLIATFSKRSECLYSLRHEVRVQYLADHVRPSRLSALARARRLIVLRRIIRDVKPDVVVAFLTHVNVAALMATIGIAVPVVVSERTFPPANPVGFLLTQFRKLLYPRAAAVVLQTDQGLEWLKSACGRSRGVVIANPVQHPIPALDPSLPPDVIVPASRRLLLAVGRLGPEKGFSELISAFSELAVKFPDWDLVILGDGSQRSALEQLIESRDLRSRAFLPGHAGNLADWYERADIYALSSRFEGFPNTLLEAMAHGVPAVSFDCDTGPRSIIRDGLDGILVRPADGVSAFAEALAGLMSAPLRREQMGHAAIGVRERFAVNRIGRAWDDLLTEVAR